jgi:AraC-like DNA-binding protein
MERRGLKALLPTVLTSEADVGQDVYGELAARAGTRFGQSPIRLTRGVFELLMTGGMPALALGLCVSLRTLHRLLAKQGTAPLELRTWARREGVAILAAERTPQAEIARLLGFRSTATRQAFLRREHGVTGRALQASYRCRDLAEKVTSWPKNAHPGTDQSRRTRQPTVRGIS